MSSRGDKWTDEQTEQLKKLYESGIACSAIANEMACGFTRNAIIGKIHRLGLPLRGQVKGKSHPKKKEPKRTRAARVVWANGNSDKLRLIDYPMIEQGPVRCAEIEPRNLLLTELDLDDCRYPYGEGADIRFCGHQKIDDGSYCFDHSLLVRSKPRSNSEAVTEARARRMRGINFRRSLLEAAE